MVVWSPNWLSARNTAWYWTFLILKLTLWQKYKDQFIDVGLNLGLTANASNLQGVFQSKSHWFRSLHQNPDKTFFPNSPDAFDLISHSNPYLNLTDSFISSIKVSIENLFLWWKNQLQNHWFWPVYFNSFCPNFPKSSIPNEISRYSIFYFSVTTCLIFSVKSQSKAATFQKSHHMKSCWFIPASETW